MRKLLILFLLFVNAKSLVSENQLDDLSQRALALRVVDMCLELDYIGIENRYSLYKLIPLKIKTNGVYYHETNLYKLVELCNNIKKD